MNYSKAILNLNIEENDFASKIITSKEAYFYCSGYVNKQNLHFWGTENPRVIHEEPINPLKRTVLCDVHAGGVIGLYFFEDVIGNTVTVTGERYRAMVNDFIVLDEQGLVNIWFQQDGATAHTARATMDIVKEAFPGRVISNFGMASKIARFNHLRFLSLGLLEVGGLSQQASDNRSP